MPECVFSCYLLSCKKKTRKKAKLFCLQKNCFITRHFVSCARVSCHIVLSTHFFMKCMSMFHLTLTKMLFLKFKDCLTLIEI